MAHEMHEIYARMFPPFPFQVYVLASAKKTLGDCEFPNKFVERIVNLNCLHDKESHVHFEFYRSRFNNVLSCTAHQQKEIESRNRNAVWPRLIPNWDLRARMGYPGFILVIDRDDWQANGVLVVHFDGRHGASMGYDAPGGEDSILWAERMYSPDCLGCWISSVWSEAGGTWTQSNLDGYNKGQTSPVLYPALDPSAHEDAEHDDIQDDHSVSEQSAGSESMASGPLRPQIPEVDIRDLMKAAKDLEGSTTTTYEGHAGWETTSVWRQSLSKTRPPFAFTLYLPSDSLPFAAEALFACLDRELLSTAAWTLDVIRNVPNMQSALHHYSHEKRYRAPEKTAMRIEWARMLLNKICAPWLPEELVQIIEDMLVPLHCPNYSAPPDRVFHDMFLYLDPSAPLMGPKIVYSNHFQEDIDPEFQRRRRHKEPVLKLHVTDLGSWRLVSDELHILWSLCSPRLKIATTDLPLFLVHLYFPEVCALQPRNNPDDHGEQWPEKAVAKFKLRGTDETIVLHDQLTHAWTISDDFWYTALECCEADEGAKLPNVPIIARNIEEQRLSSWSEDPLMRSPDYLDDDPGDDPDDVTRGIPKCMSPQKGRNNLQIAGRQEWWLAMYEAGWLKDGHEYIVRVKRGWGMRRWTYGSMPGLKGPYNLPPIPVHGQNECRFKFVLSDRKAVRGGVDYDDNMHTGIIDESTDDSDSDEEINDVTVDHSMEDSDPSDPGGD